MSLTFERATAADAEALVTVQIRAFHNDALIYPDVAIGGPPGYDSAASVLEKIGDAIYYKIVAEGQIIGGIVVFEQGQGHYHLDLLYLDPDYHNRGIGTRALQFIEQAHPARKWSLHTPAYALRNQHFYEKVGYVKIGEALDDDLLLFAYEKHTGSAERL